MKCNKCNNDLKYSDKYCRECGKINPNYKQYKTNIIDIVLYIFGSLLILGYIFNDETDLPNQIFAILFSLSLFKIIYVKLFAQNNGEHIKILRIVIPIGLMILWMICCPVNDVDKKEEVTNGSTSSIQKKEQDKNTDEIGSNVETNSSDNSSNQQNEHKEKEEQSTSISNNNNNSNNNINNNNSHNNSNNSSTTTNDNSSTTMNDNSNTSSENNIVVVEKKKYKIEFKSNDALNGNLPSVVYIEEGNNYTLPNYTVKKKSILGTVFFYDCKNGCTGAEGNGAAIDRNSFKIYNQNGWKEITSNTCMTSGQSININKDTVLYPCFEKDGENVSANFPIVTRDGYTFDGWYTQSHCAGYKNQNNYYAGIGTQVYYACWNKED